MTTTGPNRDRPTNSGAPHNAAAQCAVDSVADSTVDVSVGIAADAGRSSPRLDRAQVIAEVITLVVCVPLAPTLMVMVAVQGWPPWWLMVTGMLAAWAGDALWTLGEHTVAGVRARRHATATRTRDGFDRVARGRVDPQYWRGNPPRTGGHR